MILVLVSPPTPVMQSVAVDAPTPASLVEIAAPVFFYHSPDVNRLNRDDVIAQRPMTALALSTSAAVSSSPRENVDERALFSLTCQGAARCRTEYD